MRSPAALASDKYFTLDKAEPSDLLKENVGKLLKVRRQSKISNTSSFISQSSNELIQAKSKFKMLMDKEHR